MIEHCSEKDWINCQTNDLILLLCYNIYCNVTLDSNQKSQGNT